MHVVLLITCIRSPCSGIILQYLVFDLLHESNELVEGDALFLSRLQGLKEHCPGLCRIPLERSHDRLEIPNVDAPTAFFVEEVKNVSQILDLIFGETARGHPILTLVRGLLLLLLVHWWGREVSEARLSLLDKHLHSRFCRSSTV